LQRTRFAKAFKRDESVGDEVSRKYSSGSPRDGEAIQHRAEQREERAAEGSIRHDESRRRIAERQKRAATNNASYI